MKAFHRLLSIVVLAAIGCLLGCASPYHFSKREVRREALQEAAAAISNGQLYIYEAGTFDTHETPGVATEDSHLIGDLPRKSLPSGCTNPQAGRSVAYAETFNREIVQHLIQKP